PHSCLWSDLIIRCELHRNCLLAAVSVPVSSAPSRNSLQAGRSDHRPTHPDIPVPRAPMPPTETMVIGKWRTPPSKLRAQGHGSMILALLDAPDVPARRSAGPTREPQS